MYSTEIVVAENFRKFGFSYGTWRGPCARICHNTRPGLPSRRHNNMGNLVIITPPPLARGSPSARTYSSRYLTSRVRTSRRSTGHSFSAVTHVQRHNHYCVHLRPRRALPSDIEQRTCARWWGTPVPVHVSVSTKILVYQYCVNLRTEDQFDCRFQRVDSASEKNGVT